MLFAMVSFSAFQSTPSVGRATSMPTTTTTMSSLFQSTPSVGRATFSFSSILGSAVNISIHALRGEGDRLRKSTAEVRTISIHALRGEGDFWVENGEVGKKYFNPRPPWGGRHFNYRVFEVVSQFQSTPSVGRATEPMPYRISIIFISIHALRGEGDCTVTKNSKQINDYFNPRPPWGGRPDRRSNRRVIKYFNPRPPWGGRPVHWSER